jgi:hypothetical protein
MITKHTIHPRLLAYSVISVTTILPLTFSLPASAAGQQIVVDYNVNVGPVNPDGSAPWMQAIITDITGGNGVQFDFIGLFSSTNFVSEIAFNLVNDSPSYLSTLTAKCIPLSGSTSCTTGTKFVAGQNGQSVNNFMGFDMTFFLPPPKGGPENTLGAPPDAVRFILAGNGLDVTDFIARNAAGFYTMAKIQSITNPPGSTSITIGKPLTPTTFSNGNGVPGPLAVAGVFSAFTYSRKLRKRITHS